MKQKILWAIPVILLVVALIFGIGCIKSYQKITQMQEYEQQLLTELESLQTEQLAE